MGAEDDDSIASECAEDVELVCEACGRDADAPWEFPLDGWRDILFRVAGELNRDSVTVVSAGVAFFGLLAFVPAVGSLISVYGLLADPKDVAFHVAALGDVLPDAAATLVRDTLERLVARSTSSLGASAAAGVLLTIWSTSRGMASLVRALTIAYDEDEVRGWVKERAASFALTAITLSLAAASIGVVVGLPVVLAFLGLGTGTRAVLGVLRWPALACLSVVVLSALYRYGPARRPAKWRWVIVGAIVATVLWIAGSSMLSLYVHILAGTELTGPVGAVIVLMIWMFVSAYAVVLGAELNAECEHQTRRDTTIGPDRPAGQRGAHAADAIGPCRPRLREVVRQKIRAARDTASQLKSRVSRVDRPPR